METWQRQLSGSITKVDQLPFISGDPVYREKLKKVAEVFPIRINSYFASQIKSADDPLWRQVVPTEEELDDFLSTEEALESDPLKEERDMPVPELVHRYPDRVLLMINNHCPIICRFCTRKRKIGFPGLVTRETLSQGIDYISRHPEVRDVIMSGGDPLLVPDRELERILTALREIKHLEIIRLGTRVPGTLPERITPKLCEMLKKFHPLYANLHFNHPDEITPEVELACNRLADTGIPLGSQTVLLKGINDSVEVMKELVHRLLKIRVKPYYIYQADMTMGTDHFRTSVETGLNIIKGLMGHTSGMGVPYYVIDTPGGGGKVRLLPDTVVSYSEEEVVVTNFEGKTYRYPQPTSHNRKPEAPADTQEVATQENLCGLS